MLADLSLMISHLLEQTAWESNPSLQGGLCASFYSRLFALYRPEQGRQRRTWAGSWAPNYRSPERSDAYFDHSPRTPDAGLGQLGSQ